MILGYILGNPGAYYREIKDALRLNNGTYDYHIRVLLREQKIKKRTDGARVRFFPFSFTVDGKHFLTDGTDKEHTYLLYFRQHKIATVKEIARYFSTTKQNVYPTIKSLKKKGLIFYKEEGWISKHLITLTKRGYQEIESFLKGKW